MDDIYYIRNMEFGQVLLFLLTLGIIVVRFVAVGGLPMPNETNGTYTTTSQISTDSPITTTQGILNFLFLLL